MMYPVANDEDEMEAMEFEDGTIVEYNPEDPDQHIMYHPDGLVDPKRML